MSFKVNVSIGDFSPLLREPEFLFKGLREAGADGIELCIGVKSRWTPAHYERLSKKYGLPIVSVHQPVWAMTGVFFDEKFLDLAKKLSAGYATCHPLPRLSFNDARMHAYLKRLSAAQSRTGVHIFIENLPRSYRNGPLNFFFPPAADNSILDLYGAATAYGLGITLDTDHLHASEPHKEPWFETIFPGLGNIHLSSFSDTLRHLPLDTGSLKTAGFIRYLKHKKYDGLLTLEVGAKPITAVGYDFGAVRRSIEMIA